MRTYSVENWFRWGYDHVPFAFRTSAEQQLTVDFGLRARRPVKSFFEESVLAAKLIYEVHGKPTIQYSGGLDSEMIVSAFRHAGVPFKCQTLRYTDELNSHDIAYAEEYCKSYNIEQEFVDVDPVKFLLSDKAEEHARTSQTKQVAYTLFFDAMLNRDDFFIHGGGEPVVEWQPDMELLVDRVHQRRWMAWEHERYYSPLKFMMKHDVRGLPCFYHYTPELWTSFFKNKYIQRMVRNQYSKSSVFTSEQLKHQINEGHTPKTRIKYNGFERMLDNIWERCNQINNAAEFAYGDNWAMPYEDVLAAMDYQS